jgi:hypothetical protein
MVEWNPSPTERLSERERTLILAILATLVSASLAPSFFSL